MSRHESRTRLATEAWESLFRAQVAVARNLQADPAFKKVTMREYDVLFNLSRCPSGWLRLNELNDHVLLSQPSISRMVDRLERQGLVQRKTVEEDRRGVLIGLTPAGRDMQRDIGREHVRDIDRLVGSGLSAAELKTLKKLTDKLMASVRQTGDGAQAADGQPG
jgi:DNA-binding MarR family transcriptional regulator